MELVWVSGRSLSGVSVGLWEGPVQGQCGCVGGFCLGTLWVCQGSLSGVSVDLSRSLWSYRGPCAGSVWVYGRSLFGVSVGLTHSLWGALHCCPFCTSRQEKGKGLSPSGSLLFCQGPFCVISPNRHLSSSSPDSALTSWCL